MTSLPERVGRLINELDIDFSRLSIAGWFTSLASLSVGLLTALVAYRSVVGLILDDRGPALVFGLTMIGTTVASFLVMRAIFAMFGIAIVRAKPTDEQLPP